MTHERRSLHIIRSTQADIALNTIIKSHSILDLKMPSTDPIYLKRYSQVMNDRLPSQFLISQSISIPFNKEIDIHELWKLHDTAMNYFREKFDKISSIEELSPRAPSSLLDLKVAIADKILQNCHFCERRCGINRKKKETGYCRMNAISRYSAEIARIITLRRAYGSKNVNFVTPTPHTHTILKILNALKVNVPVVWNSNMYYSHEVARLLEGVVDVYLGDLRYGNDECARKYSNAPDYWSIVTENFKTAYKNGDILLCQLVLPNHIECCTLPIIEWTKKNIPNVRFNLMFQYSPNYRAHEFPQINRALTGQECEKAIDGLKNSGIEDILT